MKIEVNNNKALVFTPYNADFVKKVKLIGGAKWDSTKKAWSVPATAVNQVREIMQEVYGETDLPADGAKVSVRVKVVSPLVKTCDGIRLFGKTIAEARNRDGGSRVGDDVAFVAGEPESGGSARRWETIIKEGAEFVVHNVVEAMISEDERIEIISIEREDDVNLEALRKEKESLLKRLAEINKLLGEE